MGSEMCIRDRVSIYLFGKLRDSMRVVFFLRYQGIFLKHDNLVNSQTIKSRTSKITSEAEKDWKNKNIQPQPKFQCSNKKTLL